MEAKDTEKPSRTMPTWSSVLLNSPRCLAPVRGSTPMFPTSVPRQMRPGQDPDLGHQPMTHHGAAQPERQDGQQPAQRPAKTERVAGRRQRCEWLRRSLRFVLTVDLPRLGMPGFNFSFPADPLAAMSQSVSAASSRERQWWRSITSRV